MKCFFLKRVKYSQFVILGPHTLIIRYVCSSNDNDDDDDDDDDDDIDNDNCTIATTNTNTTNDCKDKMNTAWTTITTTMIIMKTNNDRRTRFYASHCKKVGVFKTKIPDMTYIVGILMMSMMSCHCCMKCLFHKAWHLELYVHSTQMQVWEH